MDGYVVESAQQGSTSQQWMNLQMVTKSGDEERGPRILLFSLKQRRRVIQSWRSCSTQQNAKEMNLLGFISCSAKHIGGLCERVKGLQKEHC